MGQLIIITAVIIFFLWGLYWVLVEFIIRGPFNDYDALNQLDDPIDEFRIRKYNIDLFIDDDIYTVDEWVTYNKEILFSNHNGVGYWVKNGKRTTEEVFHSPQLDATHVVWYNK